MKEIYLTDGHGALGPYGETEIAALNRGKQTLGWPDHDVWRVKADSLEEARAIGRRELARGEHDR